MAFPSNPTSLAAHLMSAFARRTGLSPPTQNPRRYLWTDAFAVCNFLELFKRTGDQEYRRVAAALIEQVHRVLGRYRNDESRTGWISDLDEEAGRCHPTSGGLRIGKPLKERGADEVIDEQLEWNRDGQYFHYLTKWMHALCRMAFVTRSHAYARLAYELAEIAFKGFARRSGSGELVGVYWKMSTDLSRSLVSAVGLHDALDGFITFREVQHVIVKVSGDAEVNGLGEASDALFALCEHGEWATDDPLGVGGLLFDACRLCQLLGEENRRELHLLQDVMHGSGDGLNVILKTGYLKRLPQHRLAFRELGLAIGLRAVPILSNILHDKTSLFGNQSSLVQALDLLLPCEGLSNEIVSFWLPYSEDPDESWKAHQDINDVMLATAIIPHTFLSVGERVDIARL
jgi:hypothetical protein